MPTYDYFNPSLIISRATPEIISRGRSYFFSGHASVIACSRFRSVVSVRGSEPQPYSVTLHWSAAGAQSECSCAFVNGDQRVVCKHKVAAALATEHYLRLHPRVSWQTVMEEAIGTAPKPPAKVTKSVVLFSLQNRYNNWAVFVYQLPAGNFDADQYNDTEHIYTTVLRDQLSSKAKHARTPLERGRVVNDAEYIQIAADLCWAYQQAAAYSWNSPQTVNRLLPFLKHTPLFYGTEDNPLRSALRIEEGSAHLEAEIVHVDEGVQIVPVIVRHGKRIPLTGANKTQAIRFISASPSWAILNDTLIQVDGPVAAVAPLLKLAEMTIPPDEMAEFTARYLAPLAARLPVAGEGIEWTDLDAEPKPRLYLTQNEGGEPIAELRFAYGDDVVIKAGGEDTETTIVHVSKDNTFVRVHRKFDTEDDAEKLLTRHGLRKDHKNGEYALRSTTNVISFLMHQVPQLVEEGFEIFGEENLSGAKINRSTPRLSMRVSSGIDWFDVQMAVSFGDATAPLKVIRQALKKREKYIKLSDGSIGALPEDWVKKYSYLFSLGTDSHDDETGESLRLSKHHAALLGDVLDESDSHTADLQFTETLTRLRNFKSIGTHSLPPELAATLRPYQKHGFDWLHFLREYGAGGCIADDMGLGKTVQVLAFLLSLHQEIAAKDKRRASLVVVPRSLIFNWQREAARFTPSLRILTHADQFRDKDSGQFDSFDIVLTTYGILLRDIEMLKEYQFRCAVLDESQAIKNPVALSAKASRLIKADQRLTLTGTPVENSTQDLWSQFAFLNPGLLGSLEHFRSQFGAAIDRSQDEERAAMLRRMVHPFILRRTKEQVAPELPPRTEEIVYTEMHADQRKVYDKTKAYYQNLLLGMIEKEGMAKARMKVLEGLLRLRQICNHPKLVNANYDGPASKFEGLLETLITLRDEGHKALVFSQFVQMLKLVQKDLDRLKIPYEFLTGQTRDRQERVDSFQQNPDIPFFLISLKAGGVGLNLTAADYVIHIDPWWNPAVEMQATDRAHRIGQDKPVFIYKMIAKDTVEDKILQLQERKREVVRQVVGAESGFFKSLTKDDIAGLFE